MKKLLALLLLAALGTQAENVLHRSNDDEPSTLDPQLAQGMPEMHILRDMFLGLVDEAPDASLIAGAAERWEISKDGLTYTFHLRDGKWSDGTAVTAQDFVYAWQRALDPAVGSKYAFFLYPIKNAKTINEGNAEVAALGTEAIDARTLKVQLENPTPYFLGMLTNAVAYPVPKAVVEKHQKEWTRPENIVSNGAFTLQEWQPQARLVLAKAPHYFNADQVSLDKVIYYPTQPNAALQRYRAGELDFTSDVPVEQLKWVRENLPQELHTHSQLGVFYYGFNLTKPPFKDNIKLREALTLAVEREPIVKNITGSGEEPAYSFVVPGVDNYGASYRPAYADMPREERIARAKQLYAEAGYGKDNPLKVELLYNTNENNQKISVAIAAMWKQTLGVKTELINKEWKTYLSDRRSYNTQVFRGSWLGDYNDANTFLDLFVSGGGSNTVGLADPEFDALIAQAAQTQDMGKRSEILHQAEKRLIDNFSLIPVYYFVSKHMVKPYVSGYEANVMDHWQSKYLKVNRP